MGHFLHRSECRSWLYGWRCPECAGPIFVYQCTCGSGVFFETRGPPWTPHDCDRAMIKASMDGAGGWLRAGLDPSTGKGAPFASLKGFVATGSGGASVLVMDDGRTSPPPPSPPVLGVKAMDPMPGETESFIGVVRELQTSTARLKDLYADLGDIGRKLLGLPPLSVARQITVEQNDLDPVESYTAVLPAAQAQGVTVSQMVWIQIEARHAADRSAWVVTGLDALN